MFRWNLNSAHANQIENESIHSISSDNMINESLLSASADDFPECSFALNSSHDSSGEVQTIQTKNLEIRRALKSKVSDLRQNTKHIIYMYGEDIHTDTQSLINKSDKVLELRSSELQVVENVSGSQNLKGLTQTLDLLQTKVRSTRNEVIKEKETLEKYMDDYEKLKKKVEEVCTQVEDENETNENKSSYCQCLNF